MLDPEALRVRLPVEGLGQPFHYLETVSSTNDLAGEQAGAGAPHGALVVAEEQTRGRGRGGRTWSTPARSGLAFSLILRPPALPAGSEGMLTVVGALAVAEALERRSLAPEIKWPNDVLLDRKKVAGILAEAAWDGGEMAHVILGIGVNVRKESVPEDRGLDFPATCVEAALGRAVDRGELLLEILGALGRWLPRLGSSDVTAAWDRLLAYRGEQVIAAADGVERRGRVVGVGADGRLRLATDDAGSLDLNVGEIRLRPVDTGPD